MDSSFWRLCINVSLHSTLSCQDPTVIASHCDAPCPMWGERPGCVWVLGLKE